MAFYEVEKNDKIGQKNKEIAEFIFDKMKEMGFKPYNIEYGDAYFIFQGEDNSIIHFRLKGVSKRWKFGMWINSEYLEEEYLKEEKEKQLSYEKRAKVVQIFAQYDTQIDKFKPSRSALCVSYFAEDWQDNLTCSNPFWELEYMFKMMKRHPFLCYANMCGNDIGFIDYSFILHFISNEWSTFVPKLKRFWYGITLLPYTKLKCYLAKKNSIIKEIKIYNFEKENPGWSTDYLYGIRIIFTKNSTDEKEVKWLDKWFKHNKYGKIGYFDYYIELQDLFREGVEGPYFYTED